MERDSLVYAQIGDNNTKGYRSADGLPLDLGDGNKIYKHKIHITHAMNTDNDLYLYVLSSNKTPYSEFGDIPEGVCECSGSLSISSDAVYMFYCNYDNGTTSEFYGYGPGGITQARVNFSSDPDFVMEDVVTAI